MGRDRVHNRHRGGTLLKTVRAQVRLRPLAAAAVCFALFGWAWVAVHLVQGRALPFDEAIEAILTGIRWGALQPLVDFVAWLNGPRQTIAGFAIVIVVSLLWLRVAPLMIAAAASGSLYSMILSVVARPRPPSTHDSFTGFGFPSGHAVFFTTYAVLLALVLRRRLPPRLARAGVAVLALVWLVAVVSRVWAHAHWASDVLAGIALALGWVSLVLSVRWLSAPVLDDDRTPAGVEYPPASQTY